MASIDRAFIHYSGQSIFEPRLSIHTILGTTAVDELRSKPCHSRCSLQILSLFGGATGNDSAYDLATIGEPILLSDLFTATERKTCKGAPRESDQHGRQANFGRPCSGVGYCGYLSTRSRTCTKLINEKA